MIKATIPWNCKQIHRMVNNGSLVFDNAIQRGFVWDRERMSLLVDSILRDYPVPAFYTIRDGRTVMTPKGNIAVFDALDGRQRCQTITAFRDDGFALCGIGSPVTDDDGNTVELNGKRYSDLTDALRNTFDTFALNCTYFTDVTYEEVVEIMRRLNNGKPLTGQELVRIRARDLPGIQRMAKHPMLDLSLSPAMVNGYKNEDTVIKMYILLCTDSVSFDKRNIDAVYRSLEVTHEVHDAVTYVLDSMLETHRYLLENEGKKADRKFTTRTHLVSLALAFRTGLEDGRSTAEMAGFVKYFLNGAPSVSEAYNRASLNGTGHASSVLARIDAVAHEYCSYFATSTGANMLYRPAEAADET